MAVDRIGRQPLSIEGPMLIVILLKSHQKCVFYIQNIFDLHILRRQDDYEFKD